SAVTIRVAQGERDMFSDCKMLGQFDLVGIAPAPRGVPQIEVTFDIDANGLVHVSAKDKGTGQEQSIQIKASGGLSDEEVEKMVNEAEAHAEEDAKKRKLIDARNQADSLIYSTEKSIKDNADKINDELKSQVEAAVAEVKKALDGEDAEAIEGKTQALMEISMKLGEAIYKDAGADAGGPGGPGAEASGADPSAGASASAGAEDVVDAEFEEVKDNEKK
ncbi:MAG: Hsp70 family protein, partial [Magnetococcales bacterium]|nr:Hsp70 family protein [Magnetococcales bacterium]